MLDEEDVDDKFKVKTPIWRSAELSALKNLTEDELMLRKPKQQKCLGKRE